MQAQLARKIQLQAPAAGAVLPAHVPPIAEQRRCDDFHAHHAAISLLVQNRYWPALQQDMLALARVQKQTCSPPASGCAAHGVEDTLPVHVEPANQSQGDTAANRITPPMAVSGQV